MPLNDLAKNRHLYSRTDDKPVRLGLFCALYSLRAGQFFHTPKAGQQADDRQLTHLGRAMQDVGIQTIRAYSTAAPGRRRT